jgi:hypothetical protein
MRTKKQRIIAYIIYCVYILLIIIVYKIAFFDTANQSTSFAFSVSKNTNQSIDMSRMLAYSYIVVIMLISLYILWIDKPFAILTSIFVYVFTYFTSGVMLVLSWTTKHQFSDFLDEIEVLVYPTTFIVPIFIWEITHFFKKKGVSKSSSQ